MDREPCLFCCHCCHLVTTPLNPRLFLSFFPGGEVTTARRRLVTFVTFPAEALR